MNKDKEEKYFRIVEKIIILNGLKLLKKKIK
jgi:hypothetical protein